MKNLLLALALLLVSTASFGQATSLFTGQGTPSISTTGAYHYKFGTIFTVDVPGWAVGFKFYKASGYTSAGHTMYLYEKTGPTTGTLLVQAATTSDPNIGTAAGWVNGLIPTPVFLVPGKEYVIAAYLPANLGSANWTSLFLTNPVNSGVMHAAPGINGVWSRATTAAGVLNLYPSFVSGNKSGFTADIVFIPGYAGTYQ